MCDALFLNVATCEITSTILSAFCHQPSDGTYYIYSTTAEPRKSHWNMANDCSANDCFQTGTNYHFCDDCNKHSLVHHYIIKNITKRGFHKARDK